MKIDLLRGNSQLRLPVQILRHHQSQEGSDFNLPYPSGFLAFKSMSSSSGILLHCTGRYAQVLAPSSIYATSEIEERHKGDRMAFF